MLKWVYVLLLFALVACGRGGQELQLDGGVDITGVNIKPEFTLTDHSGNVRHLQDFKGKVVAVFFGYTRCPDVCPTTMLALAGAAKLLEDRAQNLQVLFVTVDPQRDTQEVLAQYVPSFDSSFIGLYGTEAQLRLLTKSYRVVYSKQQAGASGYYTVDHSAGVYLIDQNGEIRAYLRHDATPEQLAHDITQFF